MRPRRPAAAREPANEDIGQNRWTIEDGHPQKVMGAYGGVEVRAQSLQIESISALTFWWSMIFSENRIPPSDQVRGWLFRIMLSQSPPGYRPARPFRCARPPWRSKRPPGPPRSTRAGRKA